jgi:hypothetical protein
MANPITCPSTPLNRQIVVKGREMFIMNHRHGTGKGKISTSAHLRV